MLNHHAENATDPYELCGIARRIADGEREWHENFNAMTEEEQQWYLADIALSDPERETCGADIEIEF